MSAGSSIPRQLSAARTEILAARCSRSTTDRPTQAASSAAISSTASMSVALATLPATSSAATLEKNGDDLQMLSALLLAPPYLANLGEPELAALKRSEQHIDPEIRKARTATDKAMKEVEAGWNRSIAMIADRAGLVKGQDGWVPHLKAA
jgi:hypothetical protein